MMKSVIAVAILSAALAMPVLAAETVDLYYLPQPKLPGPRP
jgi:hypothetical protein